MCEGLLLYLQYAARECDFPLQTTLCFGLLILLEEIENLVEIPDIKLSII